jgi:hypothetical protein
MKQTVRMADCSQMSRKWCRQEDWVYVVLSALETHRYSPPMTRCTSLILICCCQLALSIFNLLRALSEGRHSRLKIHVLIKNGSAIERRLKLQHRTLAEFLLQAQLKHRREANRELSSGTYPAKSNQLYALGNENGSAATRLDDRTEPLVERCIFCVMLQTCVFVFKFIISEFTEYCS